MDRLLGAALASYSYRVGSLQAKPTQELSFDVRHAKVNAYLIECALVIRSTSTNYGHKRDLLNFQRPMRSNLQKSNGLDALFKSTRQQIFLNFDLNLTNFSIMDLAKWAPRITKM
jgi:hypothetical protein